MNFVKAVTSQTVDMQDILGLLDKVVLFECDITRINSSFDRTDTWIGKIPCSAVKRDGNKVIRDEQ